MNNKLRKLRLENCQSWKDATIEFGDGLNAIIASNNVGKSVIFKIIKITCNPDFFSKPERKKLIRYGSEYAKATFTFEDGSVATTIITDKKVLYTFITPNGEEYHSEEEPLNQTLQYLSVIVEDNSKYLVNVLDSEQSLLLVKSDKKANSDLMRVITEHKGVARLTELFKDKVKYYSGYEVEIKKKESRLKRRLKEIDVKDIDVVEQQYLHLSAMSKALSTLEIVQRHIKNMGDNLQDVSLVDWSRLNKLLTHINYIEELPDNTWETLLSIFKVLPKERMECPTGINWGKINQLLNALPKSEIKLQDDLINWDLIMKLLNQKKDIKLSEKDINHNCITDILKLKPILEKLEHNLDDIKDIQNQIHELNSIDFNGTVYSCPVHGKIIYNNGKCEVASNE